MIRSVVLLGTLLFSLNTFSASLPELSSALNKINSKTPQSSEKIIYTGKDILRPTVANANKLLPEVTHTEMG